jgi:hypothetical protein
VFVVFEVAIEGVEGTYEFNQPRAAVGDAAVVLRALLLTEGPASAYWPLA